MRWLRPRPHDPPPSPLPASALRTSPSLSPSPNRWFSLDHYRPSSSSSSPASPLPDSPTHHLATPLHGAGAGGTNGSANTVANGNAADADNAGGNGNIHSISSPITTSFLTPKPPHSPCSTTTTPPTPMTRAHYIHALNNRMDDMDRVPTSSFFHSYAGEFDVLLGEERRILRKVTEFDTSARAENACRNRYTNILCNEPTRVRLGQLSPGENDYINANRVAGPPGHPGYLATQAPLHNTTPHFWQMVYEAGSPLIIMLTRQLEDHCMMVKCDTYWPPAGQSVLFNDYLVQALDERVDMQRGITERRFQVGRVVDKRRKHARELVLEDSQVPPTPPATDRDHRDNDFDFYGDGPTNNNNNNFATATTPSTTASPVLVDGTPARTRSGTALGDDVDSETQDLIENLELIGPLVEVTQLQFLEWPDQHVPASAGPLLSMLRHADGVMRNAAKLGRAGPPIVHCSAGVGRTGTYIAIDVTLRRLQQAFAHNAASPVSVDDIRELVRSLKRQRSRMVQTAVQYKFIYLAVLEAMKRWEAGGPPPFGEGVNKLVPASTSTCTTTTTTTARDSAPERRAIDMDAETETDRNIWNNGDGARLLGPQATQTG